MRSKTTWYNEGEKNTKYFLNLEKRHYKQGTVSQINTTFFPENEDKSANHEHVLTAGEGAFTEKECLEKLKDVGTRKTPGTDGLPAEFYFDICAIPVRVLNYAYETGQRSVTQRRGIIKLIPKKDAEPLIVNQKLKTSNPPELRLQNSGKVNFQSLETISS